MPRQMVGPAERWWLPGSGRRLWHPAAVHTASGIRSLAVTVGSLLNARPKAGLGQFLAVDPVAPTGALPAGQWHFKTAATLHRHSLVLMSKGKSRNANAVESLRFPGLWGHFCREAAAGIFCGVFSVTASLGSSGQEGTNQSVAWNTELHPGGFASSRKG